MQKRQPHIQQNRYNMHQLQKSNLDRSTWTGTFSTKAINGEPLTRLLLTHHLLKSETNFSIEPPTPTTLKLKIQILYEIPEYYS